MMNIGLVGSKGFLGEQIKTAFKNENIFPLSYRVSRYNDISIDAINNSIKNLNLDIIINCSALIGFENCFINKWDAYNINAILPFKLALVAEIQKIKFVQISTEAVFANGVKLVKYSELDKPNPSTVYGKSKYKGEQLIADFDYSSIIRLPKLFNSNTQIVSMLLKKIINKENVKISDDLFSTPLHVRLAAELIAEIITGSKFTSKKLLHISGDTQLSLYSLVRRMVSKNYLHLIEKTSNSHFDPNPKEPPLLNCGLQAKPECTIKIEDSIKLFEKEIK